MIFTFNPLIICHGAVLERNKSLTSLIVKKAPWLLGIIITTLAIFNDGYSVITVDMMHAIELSKAMLQGNELYKDFFEVNHPMMMYIAWIPVYIASHLSWLHEVLATTLFICVLCLISIILSYKIMILTDEYKDPYFRFTHIIALFYVTFLLPLHYSYSAELGQKSHLFFILFLPYLHSFLLHDQQRKNHPILMLFTGISAGIGLCVKIYFFIVIAILEIGMLIKQKQPIKNSWKTLFRVESLSVALIAILFLLSILCFTPEYITHIIPIAKFGYLGYASETKFYWLNFLLKLSPQFLFLFVFISIKPKFPNYHALIKLAILASLISLIPQASKWNHTALPTLGMIMLLVTAVIADIMRKIRHDFKKNHKTLSPKNISEILWVLVTLLFLTYSIAINISNYKTIRQTLYHQNNIHRFIALSKEYGDQGGAHFLIPSYIPSLYTWIYGDFSLQNYFFSTYMIDGIREYKNKQHYKNASPRMKEEIELAEIKIRDHMILDIKQQNPALIIIHSGFLEPALSITNETPPALIQNQQIKPTKINYISFLNEHKSFAKVWRYYHLKEKIISRDPGKNFPIFSIYIRKDLEKKK